MKLVKKHQKKWGIGLGIIIVVLVSLLIVVGIKIRSFFNSSATEQASEQEESYEEKHVGYEEPESDSDIQEIDIESNGFSPKELRVKVNAVVAFHNEDTMSHTVRSAMVGTDVAGAFDTGPLQPEQKMSVVQYSVPGTYSYYLKEDPSIKGTIIVAQ